jgi:rare lipoprotein A (peptidoglycan hydrolase)
VKVKATREGLVGHKTSSGYVIESVVPFVALPSVRAVGKAVRVTNPANGKTIVAIVLDVGPFNTHDDAYVFRGARPLAETGVSVSGTGTNSAGIDLGEKAWTQLGMTDNTEVEWEFV